MSHIDKINESIETLKDPAATTEFRQKAIQNIAQELSQRRNTNEMLAIARKIDELIPILNTILTNSSESTTIKRSIISFYKGKTMYPEIYDALEILFLEGIEEENLSFEAGNRMLYFDEKREETKRLLVEQLKSENEYHRLMGLKAISQWKSVTKEIWDFKPMFMRLVLEDKSPKIRKAAWSLSGRTGDKEALQLILEDLLYSSLYDILRKFQPNVQVPLSRIIELTEPLPLQKLGELVENLQLKNIDISKEQFEEGIKKLLEDKQIDGEYFEMEQVFVRKETKDVPFKPVSFSKEYLCFSCGNPLEDITKNCSSCNQEVLKCNVCKLPINFGQEIGKCTYCESVSHINHLQEWVKVKGKCPTCQKKLHPEEVVPTTAFEVKK